MAQGGQSTAKDGAAASKTQTLLENANKKDRRQDGEKKNDDDSSNEFTDTPNSKIGLEHGRS